MVAQTASIHLKTLVARIQHVRYAVERWPEAVAREMALAVQYDWRQQQDPLGGSWPATLARRTAAAKGAVFDAKAGRYRIHGKFATGEQLGTPHRFDPEGHVRDSWQPFIDGETAGISSDHPGAAALQRNYKGRRARLMHPIQGSDPGAWGKRFARVLRRLLYGASLSEEKRLALHLAKLQREARKAAARAATGKAPRKTRSDRARVDRIVVRTLRRG